MPKLKQKIQGCDPELFRVRLKATLKELKMSQRQLAIDANLNPYIITKATRYAIVPSMRSLIKISDVLNVSVSYIIGDSEKKTYVKADPPSSFHERIMQLTKGSGVRISKLSKAMPFAQNAIYEWNRTKTIPSLGYMKAIAEYFNVSLDYITGRTNIKN